MADDDGARRLSPNFNEMAKDDPERVLVKRAEALGKPGLEALSNATEQGNKIFTVRYRREIEQTEEQRFNQWVNRTFDKLTAPAPGKTSKEATPELYKQVQDQGRVWLAADTEQKTAFLRDEVDQQRREMFERTFDHMENGKNVDRAQDRNRDMGRGRGAE